MPERTRLPDTRNAITHKFIVGQQEGYITVGLYENGMPGEIFISISKEGSTLSGLFDAIAVATSISLQFGVPLEKLVRKHVMASFEPSGRTENLCIPVTNSIVDYIFRWLGLKFLTVETLETIGIKPQCQNCSRKSIGGIYYCVSPFYK